MTDILKNNLRPVCLMVIALLLVVHFILRRFGVEIEDSQTILFPFVLLAFLKLPERPVVQFASPIAVVLLALWLTSAVSVRGGIVPPSSVPAGYLARLNDDPGGMKARHIYQQYQEIAQLYKLPSLKTLQRSFSRPEQIRRWLSSHPNILYVLASNENWMDVYLNRDLDRDISTAEVSPKLLEVAGRYGLKLPQDAFPVAWGESEQQFLVATSIDHFALPVKPEELSRHFLAWFTAGLQDGEYGFFDDNAITPQERIAIRARRQSALNEAGRIFGSWRSPVPRGVASFYLGTLHLRNALESPRPDRKALACAKKSYARSVVQIRPGEASELSASVLNNKGIIRLFTSRSQADYKLAARQFAQAAKMTDKTGKPVRSAQIAMVNLLMLERLHGSLVTSGKNQARVNAKRRGLKARGLAGYPVAAHSGARSRGQNRGPSPRSHQRSRHHPYRSLAD